ncbi:MAG TPA: NAD-dependent epimerase/dehydratase family protein [Vicinamibacterales bacterium]
MRLLVTGGTGFIGRRLMHHLIERFGAGAITCLIHGSDKPMERAAAAAYEAAGVTIVHGDLTHTPVSATPAPPVDLVFHLGANIDTDTPEHEHRVNDEGTANLLLWLGPGLKGCRIVYTSSIAVHDRNGLADGPLREDSPFTPRTAYGVTKLRGERILQEAAARREFTWTIPRLPTVYGPGGKAGGMFDLLIAGVRTGGLISRINWPGRSSVIFVDDVAAILTDLALQPSAANEIYCLSSGEDLTLGDIAREAGALVGRPPRPIRLPSAAWAVIRRVAWSPVVRALVPRRAHVTYWRLTLVVDDGFWYDARKFLAQNTRPLVQIREGLQRTIAG